MQKALAAVLALALCGAASASDAGPDPLAEVARAERAHTIAMRKARARHRAEFVTARNAWLAQQYAAARMSQMRWALVEAQMQSRLQAQAASAGVITSWHRSGFGYAVQCGSCGTFIPMPYSSCPRCSGF